MQIIRGLNNLRPEDSGCVATIGKFDGVHRGHKMVIDQLRNCGNQLGLPVTVITFEPQPPEFFSGATAPARLTNFRDKLNALRAAGVDRVCCLRFNRLLAATPADDFVHRYLVQGLGIKHLVVGDDFRYGRGRTGDFDSLVAAGKHYVFNVERMASCIIKGRRVSSSWLRQLLEVGDFVQVCKVLGRPYKMTGRVRHGRELGRSIGFPTANIALGQRRLILAGVYCVRVHGMAPTALPAISNIGYRPTIDNSKQQLLEVHIMDYSGNLYGRNLEVEIVHKVRNEQKFASIDALVSQIRKDVLVARRYFSRNKSRPVCPS
ncbi:MAG TPA: bifunctional riboflavin kinase/FAD synthetase [Gammaproteobacteria bacterium]|nr:bifunctional riboflavin kinase/FAD synthetase [Gammaproteobacteria bacterium]